MWLSLGSYLLGGTLVLWRGWMPWRTLGKLPVLKEILPDQLTPLVPLFIAFILALGLDAVYRRVKATSKKQSLRVEVIPGLATLAVAVAALLPVFWTFDMPFTVQSTAIPAWMAHDAPSLPPQHGPVDGAVRRVGVGATHAVAGGGRHALPAGRRRHEDPECHAVGRWDRARRARPGGS